ncbi:MAG: GNAT family N-acetyltransferase [Candidatus Heimdallarchaeota archaeon]
MKANIKIIEVNPKKISEKLLNSFLDLLDDIHKEIYPDEDPKHSRVSRKKSMLSDKPLLDYYYWLVIQQTTTGEKVIGGSLFYTANEKNPIYDESNRYAWFWVDVAKEHRRKTYGTQLLKEMVTKVNSLGNLTTLQTFSFTDAGWTFCEKFNGELSLEATQSRLKFDEVNWELMKKWVKDGEINGKKNKTKLLFFEKIPEEIKKPYTEFYTEIMNLVPFEGLVERRIETVESTRQKEKEYNERGIRWFTMLTQEADGAISGITEMLYYPDEPYLTEQELTGVSLKYRGRGLGKWLKAAMLLHIKENLPEVRTVNTGNADSNAPMLSINHKMGFKRYLVEKCYKFNVNQLLNKLNSK